MFIICLGMALTVSYSYSLHAEHIVRDYLMLSGAFPTAVQKTDVRMGF